MSLKKVMTARRYAEHIRRAKAALDTYSILKTNNYLLPEYIKLFTPVDFLVIAIESSISAVEAFINHLGYIFSDEWKHFEDKNFWPQYKEVIKILKNLGIDICHIENEPYMGFDGFRKMIRNPLHHVHSSVHDVQAHEREIPLDGDIDLQESFDMLTCWVNPSHENAINAFNQTHSFIMYFQDKFKNKFFHSYTIAEILSRHSITKLAEDSKRETLLRRYIDDPLNPLALVSGNYTVNLSQKNLDRVSIKNVD